MTEALVRTFIVKEILISTVDMILAFKQENPAITMDEVWEEATREEDVPELGDNLVRRSFELVWDLVEVSLGDV